MLRNLLNPVIACSSWGHATEAFLLKSTSMECYYGGYRTQAIPNPTGDLSCFSISELQKKVPVPFNVLVADCKGCLELFFKENPTFAKTFRLVLLEQDYPKRCNYQFVRTHLSKSSLKEVRSGHQNVWMRL